MPYIGNTTSSFNVDTNNINNGAVTTEKLASPIAPIVSSINGGPLAGMRNLLINGNPTINQRGYASGTATSGANEYTLDRWRVVTSGQSITFTDSANVRTVTAPAGGIEQVIEGLNILSGTYVLNWTGTATATVDGASVAKGGTVTLTGGTNATVRFIGGTFSLAQLEPGTVATPFERRSYGQELALCQRYFEKSYNIDVTPGTATNDGRHYVYGTTDGGSSIGYHLRFAVAKRSNPTMTYYSTTSGAGFWNWDRSGSSSSGTVTNGGITGTTGNLIYVAVGVTWTPTAAYGHWTASAEL